MAVAAGGLAAYALWWEPRRLVVRLPSLVLRRWPAELDGLRVGLISDLHGGGPHVDADRITVLEDEAVAFAAAPREVWVAGVADPRERDPDLEAVLAPVPEGAPTLLLTHDPDVFPQVPRGVALTLAGHTHGGQVDLPLMRRWAIPSRFGDRYSGGHVEEGGRHLYVSRGVGTAGLPLRFRSPPEISVLTLLSAR
jgi:uncharacterized protein